MFFCCLFVFNLTFYSPSSPYLFFLQFKIISKKVLHISIVLCKTFYFELFCRLSNCSITEEGYKALASSLRSNPSHLIELDLTGNDPGPSGVKQLNHLLQDGHYQLKTIR